MSSVKLGRNKKGHKGMVREGILTGSKIDETNRSNPKGNRSLTVALRQGTDVKTSNPTSGTCKLALRALLNGLDGCQRPS